MKGNQLKAASFALLLFVLGCAVGALGHRFYAATVVNAKPTAEDFRHKYVSEMQSKLNLSAAQVNRLQVILDETKAKYKSVRETYHPEMLKIKEAQVERVKSILNPEQAKQYDQIVAEREQKAREQEEHDRQEDERQAALHKKVLAGQ
jgi:long-subunit acyl-CoA synthetase (AMP-forming)